MTDGYKPMLKLENFFKVMPLFILGGVLACCCTSAPEPQQTPYKDKADQMFNIVWEKYSVPGTVLFSEYYPASPEIDLDYFDDGTHQAQESSFLWPLSGLTSSAIYLARYDKAYLPYLEKSLEALEHYYDTSRVPFAYQAYPVEYDKVDRYFDDNGLVGIDYIEAYLVTGNPLHLEKAKQIFTFIIGGWDFRFEGGVPWVEGKWNQKPACSNGKLLVLAVKLYEATADEYYLLTAQAVYNWMNKYLRDSELDIVWNSWLTRDEGRVEKKPYTYNTGTVIQAAVSLYKATGEQKYLDDAKAMCEGSKKFFFHYTENGIPFTYNIPWFDIVLFRGYQDYFTQTGDSSYADVLITALDYAWENARDPQGLVCNDWTARRDQMHKPKWLLDSSCIIEFMARTAVIRGEIK